LPPAGLLNSLRLKDVHDAVVIASDGLWEVVDADNCAALVSNLLHYSLVMIDHASTLILYYR
jgi:serine/threonine protein phosphatase PrpC